MRPKLKKKVFRSGLRQPRGIHVTENGSVLIIERGRRRVVSLFDDDGNDIADSVEELARTPANAALYDQHRAVVGHVDTAGLAQPAAEHRGAEACQGERMRG